MEKPKRMSFDNWRREVFLDIYNYGENGYFHTLLTDKSCSKNLEKMAAWKKITAQYNTRTGDDVTKAQLQELLGRIKKGAVARLRQRRAAREAQYARECRQTGGGPGPKALSGNFKIITKLKTVKGFSYYLSFDLNTLILFTVLGSWAHNNSFFYKK
jgi:hypothetical protein